jgi:transaldolase
MPEVTLRAVGDHGQVPADSVRGHYAEQQQVLDRLQAFGIDYDDVVQKLEDEGVAAFEASWDRLREQLSATLRAHPARQHRS